MPIAARVGAGDPLAHFVRQGSLAIQAGCDFQAHPGPSACHARHVPDVQLARLGFQQSRFHGNSRLSQLLETFSGDLWIGVLHRGDHSCQLGSQDCVGTRRRAPLMYTWLQRYISSGTRRMDSGRFQRHDFGVSFPSALMPPFAHNGPAFHQYASDPRIGRGGQ